MIDTSTIYSRDAYSLAIQEQDGDGMNDDLPGVYGPQKMEVLFWIISVILILWVLAVIVISILHAL